MWIDPANPKHIILGHDGGVDFSYDAGRSWQLQNWMPLGQFYQVPVDMREPYYVYGGAQDNGVWGGPSRVRNNGGITREHWFELNAGDGFHVAADPTDPIGRHHLGVGQRRPVSVAPEFPHRRAEIRPADAAARCRNGHRARRHRRPVVRQHRRCARAERNTAFQLESGLAMSPHDPRTIYFGSNRLYISHDRGDRDTDARDLTARADRDALQIMERPRLAADDRENDGVANWGTIVAIAESPDRSGHPVGRDRRWQPASIARWRN